MMHLLRKYDVAPVGRNDGMFVSKCGEATHHLPKANITQKSLFCQ